MVGMTVAREATEPDVETTRVVVRLMVLCVDDCPPPPLDFVLTNDVGPLGTRRKFSLRHNFSRGNSCEHTYRWRGILSRLAGFGLRRSEKRRCSKSEWREDEMWKMKRTQEDH